MSVITKEHADRILQMIPPPEQCDGCSTRFDQNIESHPVQYGPFEIYVCIKCKESLERKP